MNHFDKKRTVGEMAIIIIALIGMVVILAMAAWKIGSSRAPNDATNLWCEAHYRAAQALRAEEP